MVVTEYREEARAGMQAMTRQMNDPLGGTSGLRRLLGDLHSRGLLAVFASAPCCRRAFNDANIFRTIVQPLLDNLTLRA
nr:Uncharacterised protein [Raoultella sp. NCTC 9187]